MRENGIFFVSEQHKQNYRDLLIHFDVRSDRKYSSACYVVAHPEIFRKVNWKACERPLDFMNWRGNNRVDLSNGYLLLVQMAKNLLNSNNQFNLMDALSTWDSNLLQVFHQAMDIRLGKARLSSAV